ncbi:hypothetical protein N7450_000939 [Penicillium hetheringtonii]|uniref:Uncharacterized protein n=1 Tax=Penicillium hetheringtonii TaxID=911720 RepID=A0AAD6E3M2_9EURO|nr:hypothetical protein N7450_000939 [Penicillium hetheringtonii]
MELHQTVVEVLVPTQHTILLTADHVAEIARQTLPASEQDPTLDVARIHSCVPPFSSPAALQSAVYCRVYSAYAPYHLIVTERDFCYLRED